MQYIDRLCHTTKPKEKQGICLSGIIDKNKQKTGIRKPKAITEKVLHNINHLFKFGRGWADRRSQMAQLSAGE